MTDMSETAIFPTLEHRVGISCALSVVVPCYNEEESLLELHRRVSAICQETVGDDYELVFVNDGSHDRTWPMMVDLAHTDERFRGVSLSRNHGHQLALTAGLQVCRGDRILILDADLQDPPELLPQMMQLMDDGAEIVYGQRSERLGETRFKKATAAMFYRLLRWMVDIEIPLDAGDFRLMSRRALDVLNAMPEQHRFVRGMVSWVGFRQVPLCYERQERFAGETKYPLSRMIRFALDAITSFSIKPLRIASMLGLFFGVLGIAGIIYVVVSWAGESAIPGWASVMVSVLIIGSVQLFVTGILGEYLGRLYLEAKRRPLFIIEQIVEGSVLAKGEPPATGSAAATPDETPARAAGQNAAPGP
jgi:dolichol-phosphate mannosyltransferase